MNNNILICIIKNNEDKSTGKRYPPNANKCTLKRVNLTIVGTM